MNQSFVSNRNNDFRSSYECERDFYRKELYNLENSNSNYEIAENMDDYYASTETTRTTQEELEERSKFFDSVNFIIYLKDPWKITNNCPNETLAALDKIIDHNFKHSITYDYLNLDKRLEIVEILIDYLKYLYESTKESVSKYGYIIKKENQLNSLNNKSEQNKRLEILYKLTLIMWNWADRSIEFCTKFHDLNGLRILFKYINDSSLITHLTDRLKQNKNDKNYTSLANSYKSIIGVIHNLSKYEYLYRNEWREVNALNNLLKLVNSFQELPMFDEQVRLLGYFGAIYLIKTNSDLDKLTDIRFATNNIVELIGKCSKMIALNENLERKLFKLEINDVEFKEIAIVSHKQTIWRLTELISFLTILTELDDKYKFEIYENYQLKTFLNSILFNGNITEKEAIIKLIWKLCMDYRVANLIRSDLNLYSYMLGLSLNKYLKNKTLLKYSNLILFLIENKPNTYTNNTSNKSHTNNSNFFNDNDELSESYETLRV